MESLYKKVYETYTTVNYSESNILPDKEELANATYNSKLGELKSADSKHPYFNFISSSDKQEAYLENYGNPLASVNIFRITYVVDKFEDKISLKLYIFNKLRRQGKYYSQKHSTVHFITYKFLTNDLYFGTIGKKNNKITSRTIRRNYFGGLTPPFKSMMARFTESILSFKKTHNEIVAADICHDSFNVFIKNIPDFYLDKPFNYSNMDEYLYEHYLIKNNIKYSNNFLSFIDKTPKPSKRILKKFNNKFIDSFMHINKLRGGKIKKILHTSEIINEQFYKNVVALFGEDFMRDQSYDDLKIIFNYGSGYALHDMVLDIPKKEKKRAFATLVDMVRSNNSFNTYLDHIRFYNTLNMYEKIEWKSVDISTFSNEHMEWTDRIQYYKKGVYTREYNQAFISEIEKPILDTFYPIVFTKSSQYTDESATQNNCVKTYVDRAASVIISVRCGSIESDKRATIEYSVRKDTTNDKIKLLRIQSLGKYNRTLEEEWKIVLKHLDDRVNSLVNNNEFTLPKITIENRITKITTESIFVNNFLMWESPEIKYFNQTQDYFF